MRCVVKCDAFYQTTNMVAKQDKMRLFKIFSYLVIIIIIAKCNSREDNTPPAWLEMNESIYPVYNERYLKAKALDFDPYTPVNIHIDTMNKTRVIDSKPNDSTVTYLNSDSVFTIGFRFMPLLQTKSINHN